MIRVSITKSKAGHYSVTVRKDGHRVYCENLIDNLPKAQRIAQEQKAAHGGMPTDAMFLAALGPCGK